MGQNVHVNEHVGKEMGHGLYVTDSRYGQKFFLKKKNNKKIQNHCIYTSNAAIQR